MSTIDIHTKHVLMAMFEESGKKSIFATDCDWFGDFDLQNSVMLNSEHPSFEAILKDIGIAPKNGSQLVKVEIWSPSLGVRIVHFEKEHRSVVKSIASATRKENPFHFMPTCVLICWGQKNDHKTNPHKEDVVTYIQVLSIATEDQAFILKLVTDH